MSRWFGKICLEIDKEKISLRYQLFGVNYFTQDARKYHIVKLERTHLIFAYDSQAGITAQKPQINIWTGTEKFAIGGSGSLSEPELDWLASELSEWLGIPIT